MLNMEKKTKLKPNEARKRLEAFFGPGGEGLRLDSTEGDCLSFCNDIGYVTATVTEKDSYTLVNLVTQEYEYQVKQFLGRIP